MIIRILMASVFIPALLWLVFHTHSLYYTLFVLAYCALSLQEFYGLMQAKGGKPFGVWGTLCGCLLVLCADPTLANVLSPYFSSRAESMLLVLTVFTIGAFFLAMRLELEPGLYGLMRTTLGVVYIGVLGGYFILLRNIGQGNYFVFIHYFFTWVYDGGAYFTGRTFGRHPLAPVLSPKKTWEGFVGGFVVLGLVFVLIKLLVMPQMPLTMVQGLVLVVVLGFMGQMGDLAESAFKRYAGVKDSSRFFSEYGGFLDKLDSLLFTAPVIYYFWLFVIKPGASGAP